jgi:hypothetical protein
MHFIRVLILVLVPLLELGMLLHLFVQFNAQQIIRLQIMVTLEPVTHLPLRVLLVMYNVIRLVDTVYLVLRNELVSLMVPGLLIPLPVPLEPLLVQLIPQLH